MDVLIAPPPHLKQLPEHTLSELILSLEHSGFLTHHLSLPTGYHTYHRMKRVKKDSSSSSSSDVAEFTTTPPTAEDCLSDESSSDSSTEHNGRAQLVSCTHKRPQKQKHRLHFGSMDSYMGVCRCPAPDGASSSDHESRRLHRRIDIKVWLLKHAIGLLFTVLSPPCHAMLCYAAGVQAQVLRYSHAVLYRPRVLQSVSIPSLPPSLHPSIYRLLPSADVT